MISSAGISTPLRDTEPGRVSEVYAGRPGTEKSRLIRVKKILGERAECYVRFMMLHRNGMR